MSNQIRTDVQKLAPGDMVEMFDLDATIYGIGHLRFSAGVNELNSNIIWNGNEYVRYPIASFEFSKNTSGSLPRPRIQAANILGTLSGLNKLYNDLVGSTLTRYRTLAKYLDAANFVLGNPFADPTSMFPIEIWSIDRKSHQDDQMCEYELCTPFDVAGLKLPRRIILKNVCSWQYRSAECTYAGGAVATERDVPTADINLDECSLFVSGCKLRFGASGKLPFGSFVGASIIT